VIKISKEEKKWYGLFSGDKLISTRGEGHCDIQHWKESIDNHLGRNPVHINQLFNEFLNLLEELESEDIDIKEARKRLEDLKEFNDEYQTPKNFTINEVQTIWEMDIEKGREDDNKVKRIY
jgi:hypothetical protein